MYLGIEQVWCSLKTSPSVHCIITNGLSIALFTCTVLRSNWHLLEGNSINSFPILHFILTSKRLSTTICNNASDANGWWLCRNRINRNINIDKKYNDQQEEEHKKWLHCSSLQSGGSKVSKTRVTRHLLILACRLHSGLAGRRIEPGDRSVNVTCRAAIVVLVVCIWATVCFGYLNELNKDTR